MEIFWDIALHTVEILTLLFGVLGMAFSLLLLFSPRLTRTVGEFFNRNVNVDPKLSLLDKDIKTEPFIYSHRFIFGFCMMAGSVFAFVFFVFDLNISNVASVLIGSPQYFQAFEIVFFAFAWIARIACVLGVVFGGLLLFAPDQLKRIDGKMNTWFETRYIFAKLDRNIPEVDAFFFRYPFFFGLIGALLSCLVIALSVVNLLS
jgi:hypothetical protein